MYLRDNVDVSESEQASNQGRRKRGTPRAFQILAWLIGRRFLNNIFYKALRDVEAMSREANSKKTRESVELFL